MRAIHEKITASEQSPDVKFEIKTQTDKIINKTKHDLQTNRHKIEHEYKDYYLLDKHDKESLGINAFSFGYDALDDENINGKYAITKRYTCVQNTELSKDFFADTTAKYKLVNVGHNQWYVEKVLVNGKIEKTKVFNSIAHTSKYTHIVDANGLFGNTNFEFEPDTIAGGRIYFDEILKIQNRKKDWVSKIPQNDQHIIDSLTKEISRKEQLIELAKQKSKEADSVAKSIVQERFQNNKAR